jgi:hypothetical protein
MLAEEAASSKGGRQVLMIVALRLDIDTKAATEVMS